MDFTAYCLFDQLLLSRVVVDVFVYTVAAPAMYTHSLQYHSPVVYYYVLYSLTLIYRIHYTVPAGCQGSVLLLSTQYFF
jgi:hypothetical protein